VADYDGVLYGYVLTLFRSRSDIARLYSIAVDAEKAGCGIGSQLLSAAEDAAYRRGCKAMRLEVRVGNRPAKALYETSGYRFIGRFLAYYEDGSDALRFQKPLKLMCAAPRRSES
jgi:ribosomal protein S18 acetylase RimI-like enzyme